MQWTMNAMYGLMGTCDQSYRGHVGFQVEITQVVKDKENEIIVRAKDDALDLEMPRQAAWKEKSYGIFYTRTTGIWQTVWIEAVAHTYLHKV